MNEADLLRRAADLIEQRGADATPGPWHIEYDGFGREPQAVFVECDDDDVDAHDGTKAVGGFDHPADNVWIVLLNPQVAQHLAAWLRAEADCQDALHPAGEALAELSARVEAGRGEPREWSYRVAISTLDAAVEFARAVLGETS